MNHLASSSWSSLSRLSSARSRSISPENRTGAPGGGGRAEEGTGAQCARDLGIGWKISPSVIVPAGTVFTLAEIEGGRGDSADLDDSDRKLAFPDSPLLLGS